MSFLALIGQLCDNLQGKRSNSQRRKKQKAHIWLIDLFSISCNNLKNQKGKIVVIFRIEMDITNLTVKLFNETLEKALNFINMQSVVGLCLFYSQVMKLSRAFIRRFWDFINYFEDKTIKRSLRKIFASVKKELKW